MKNILFSLCVTILFACSTIPNNNEKLIVGKWKATSWTNALNKPVEATTNVGFSFLSNGNYTYINAGLQENGTYKIENDMLFTKPHNENEMMVKIKKATTDSLVFEMNRGGQEEVITLIKDN